jgi:rhamnogalacturonyl hydrolase YesR
LQASREERSIALAMHAPRKHSRLFGSLFALGFPLACQQGNESAPRSAAPATPVPNSASSAAPATQAANTRVVATLELSNPSEFARPDSAIYLSYYDLGLGLGDHDTTALAARSRETWLAAQAADWDGDGTRDGLVVLADFAPVERKTISIVVDPAASSRELPKRTQAEVSMKVGGQWAPRKDKPALLEYVGGTFKNVRSLSAPPEHIDHSNLIRYEGPGIESDRVAFRVYLDWRNGFDIFGKKTSKPVLQDIGQDGFESYHHMADWGMDILKVGEAVGAGGFGFWNEKKLERVSNVEAWDASIIENGSLYSAFRIDYRGWKIDNEKLNVRGDFSMLAGSRLMHVRLGLSEELSNLGLGIVKHPGTELLSGRESARSGAFTYFGSYGKQSLAEDELGIGVLYRSGARDSRETDANNYVAVLNPSSKQLDYYVLAAWQGEPNGIKTRDEFERALEQESESLNMPLRRRLKTQAMQELAKEPLSADSALAWAKRMADSELARKTLWYRRGGWDPARRHPAKFEYDSAGLLPLAYDELAEVAPDAKYQSVLAAVTGSFVGEKGELFEYDEKQFNIDAVAPGRNLLRLYERTKAEKYKLAAARLRRQLKQHPRTSEGAFWHKKKYPAQLWLDGVYMGMPFLAHYSARFENGRSFNDVVNEFVVARRHLRDEATGLYFHGWDEKRKEAWADPSSGRSKEFWARGLGWYSMALVDVLDELPPSAGKQRTTLLDMVQELGAALAKVQDASSGTFFQVLDKPNAPGNYRESSASAMFSYFFAKAVRNKYLPDAYRDVALRAFTGLTREFVVVHPDGTVSLTNQCEVAGLGYGRDGSYRYYMSEPVVEDDPKGVGAFILAAVELHRLLKLG